MKIDKKHFPPISILADEKFTINVDERMGLNTEEGIKMFQNYINNMVPEARENILLSTKLADKSMCKHNRGCIKAYLKDPHKKAFGGCYMDMSMPVPSIDLFKFFPIVRNNSETGRREEVIGCVFTNIQGDKLLSSFGTITFDDFNNDSFHVEPAITSIYEEEKKMAFDYMIFLLELNCFLEYGKAAAKNIVTIGNGQRIVLPDGGGVIDNRSGLSMRCLCAPKVDGNKSDK